MSKDTVGMTLGIYGAGNEKRDVRFCGYLDLQQENLPEIYYTWMGNDSAYFLISEKGFQNIKIILY